jgi:hypothetical protein
MILVGSNCLELVGILSRSACMVEKVHVYSKPDQQTFYNNPTILAANILTGGPIQLWLPRERLSINSSS